MFIVESKKGKILLNVPSTFIDHDSFLQSLPLARVSRHTSELVTIIGGDLPKCTNVSFGRCKQINKCIHL